MFSLSKHLLISAALLVGAVAGSSELSAAPLEFERTFLLNTSGRVDLFSTQQTTFVADYAVYSDPGLLFATFVEHAGGASLNDTIRFTYHEEGTAPRVFTQSFATRTIPEEYGFTASFPTIRREGRPIPVTLTVDLLNSDPDFVIPSGPNAGLTVDSYTYSFFVVAPVPEPSTFLLFMAGGIIAGGAACVRRRWRSRSGRAIG
jgi:hypothetical protein